MNKVTLESERLFLKALSLSELSLINSNENSISETLVDSEALSDSVHSAIAKKIKKMHSVNEVLHHWYTYWLIVDKETKKGIGFIGFKGVPNENGYSEIGYSISPNYRRKGLMTEALKTLMEWACVAPNCKGVVANVLKANIGSIKVLTNCKFRLVGSNEQENRYLHHF